MRIARSHLDYCSRFTGNGLSLVPKLSIIAVYSLLMAVGVYVFNHPVFINLSLFLLLGFATWTDIRSGLIPNLIIGLGMVSASVLFVAGQLSFEESFGAGFSILGVLIGIRWLSLKFLNKPGLGMGDLKLFFVLGLLLGWTVFWHLYLAVLLGGSFASVGVIAGYLDRKTLLPFAPFITMAFLVGQFVLTWDRFWEWWAL